MNLVFSGVVGETAEKEQQAMQSLTVLIGQQRDDRLQRRLAVLGRNICDQTTQTDGETVTSTDDRRLMPASTGNCSSYRLLTAKPGSLKRTTTKCPLAERCMADGRQMLPIVTIMIPEHTQFKGKEAKHARSERF